MKQEAHRLREWLGRDEASLLITVVSAEIAHLQVEIANAAAKADEFPREEALVAANMKEMRKLMSFLQILQKYSKQETYLLTELDV